MSITTLILTSVQGLTLIAPFVALYAVKAVRHNNYEKHQKVQKILFYVCILAVLLLELQIRLSGGSGSLVQDSPYLHTTFFEVVLTSHIIGAIITYIIWGILLFRSNNKYKKRVLPGVFSKAHKKIGILTIVGLFYTAITSLIVFIMIHL